MAVVNRQLEEYVLIGQVTDPNYRMLEFELRVFVFDSKTMPTLPQDS